MNSSKVLLNQGFKGLSSIDFLKIQSLAFMKKTKMTQIMEAQVEISSIISIPMLHHKNANNQ